MLENVCSKKNSKQENVVGFRPQKRIDEYINLLYDFLKDFTDKNTGLLFSQYVEQITVCPACGKKKLQILLHKGPLSFSRCLNCKTILQNPRPSKSFLEKVYRESPASNFSEQTRLNTYESRKTLKFGPIFDKYQKYLQQGRVLDIGCSWGYFMELVKERGEMEVEGIELNPDTVEWVERNKGYKVFDRDIRYIKDLEERYNTLACWGTLTHVLDPFTFFQKCFESLKQGGVMLISTPNCQGFEFVVGSCHCLYQITVANIFSVSGLKSCLERAGFSDIDIQVTGCLDVGIVRNTLLNHSGAKNEVPQFFQDWLINDSLENKQRRESFQQFLVENRLGGMMEAIAFKK